MSVNNTYQVTESAGLLRLKSVLKLVPVSRATWLAGVRSGRYPVPVHPSPGTSAWRKSDISQLLNQMANTKSEK